MAAESFNPIIINAGKAEKLTGWNYQNISSPFARIYCLTEGSAFIKISGRIYELTPGHLYLIPPHICHDNICEKSFTHFYVHIFEDITTPGFGGSIFDGYEFPVEIPAQEMDTAILERLILINPTLRLKEYNPIAYDNKQSLMANISMEKAQEESIRLESHAIVQILMSRFLNLATPKNTFKDGRIQQAISFIYSNITNPDLNVRQMADIACLSVNQFIRRFKKATGLTPVQFLTDKRVEKAEILLLDKKIPNKDIATAVGYDNTTYFCKIFKNKTGLSPQKYRGISAGIV